MDTASSNFGAACRELPLLKVATHWGPLQEVSTPMEQLKQTYTNIDGLFSRLSAEKAALDDAMQRCAAREVQDRELLSAVGGFAERQRTVEDDVRRLFERQSESDKALEESIARIFKEKREKDRGIQMEIEELFEESARGAQEIMRRFDVAAPEEDRPVRSKQVKPASQARPHPASISSVSSPSSSLSGGSDPFTNWLASPTLQSAESLDNEFVSLTPLDTPKRLASSLSPNPQPDLSEEKPEPQKWDFLDCEQGVACGRGGEPRIKPPTSFTEFHSDFEETTPAKSLPLEPVDNTVIIPVTEWNAKVADSTRCVKVNGVRLLKNGILELSVRVLDDQTAPGALEELTHGLTKYHHETVHKLASNPRQWDFVSVQSTHGTAWHRGLILKIVQSEAQVLFIDSGFHESVSFKDIRPLPTMFRFLPQQARQARLSFVKLPNVQSQHHAEALDALEKACAGRPLTAKADHGGDIHRWSVNGITVPMPPSPIHLRLMDLGVDSDNILMSVNGQLLRNGLATVDGENCVNIQAYQSVPHLLATAGMRARNEGAGMYRREEAPSG